jgi:hypothetical protein
VFETRGCFGPEGPMGPPEAHWVTTRDDGSTVYRYGAYDDLTEFLFETCQVRREAGT